MQHLSAEGLSLGLKRVLSMKDACFSQQRIPSGTHQSEQEDLFDLKLVDYLSLVLKWSCLIGYCLAGGSFVNLPFKVSSKMHVQANSFLLFCKLCFFLKCTFTAALGSSPLGSKYLCRSFADEFVMAACLQTRCALCVQFTDEPHFGLKFRL